MGKTNKKIKTSKSIIVDRNAIDDLVRPMQFTGGWAFDELWWWFKIAYFGQNFHVFRRFSGHKHVVAWLAHVKMFAQ